MGLSLDALSSLGSRLSKGWHPEDVKAAIRKKGKTLKQLAQDSDLSASSIKSALRRPLYCGEQAIAAFLQVEPRVLWPARYDDDGTPRHPHARKRHLRKLATGGHVEKRSVA